MLDKLKERFEKTGSINEVEVVSDTLLNSEYVEGRYIPFYDHYHDVWAVKDTVNEVCYPMTGKSMTYEMCILLNHYESRLS